jgi:hypothetical protein
MSDDFKWTDGRDKRVNVRAAPPNEVLDVIRETPGRVVLHFRGIPNGIGEWYVDGKRIRVSPTPRPEE